MVVEFIFVGKNNTRKILEKYNTIFYSMSNKEEKEPKKESKKEQEVKNETTQIKKTHLAGGIFILFLMLMWPITGMIALYYAATCFGYSGSLAEKRLGLVLAIFLGPLYFIYYYLTPTYCKSNDTILQQSQPLQFSQQN